MNSDKKLDRVSSETNYEAGTEPAGEPEEYYAGKDCKYYRNGECHFTDHNPCECISPFNCFSFQLAAPAGGEEAYDIDALLLQIAGDDMVAAGMLKKHVTALTTERDRLREQARIDQKVVDAAYELEIAIRFGSYVRELQDLREALTDHDRAQHPEQNEA